MRTQDTTIPAVIAKTPPTDQITVGEASSLRPGSDGYWYDLTCHFEVCFYDSAQEEWGPWLPAHELLADCWEAGVHEIDEHLGDPREVAEDQLRWYLAPVVEDLHNTFALNRGHFRIRARVDEDAMLLATLEASPEQLAAPLLRATCAAINGLRCSARRLAGDAQRAGVSTDEITKMLRSHLSETEVRSLLTASRTADQVNALLADYQPRRSRLHVSAHEDGLVRVGLYATYPDQQWASESDHNPDGIPFDYDTRLRIDRHNASELLAFLDGHFTVTTPDGRPASPTNLVPAGLSYSPGIIGEHSKA